jgi:hypothetical protein
MNQENLYKYGSCLRILKKWETFWFMNNQIQNLLWYEILTDAIDENHFT